MRFAPLVSSLLAVVSAAPLAEENSQLAADVAGEVTQITDASDFQADRPARSGAADPSGALDSSAQGVKILKKFKEESPKDGAKRTTIKYGTWSVTSTKMLQTTKLSKGPCGVGGCLVTAMEATIRYPDGTEANADTKAWLHHIALFGSGGGQGSIWAAGNERPTLRLNDGGSKYGLDFPTAFMMMIDLMTEDTKPKSLTLELTYEHVPKTQSGYKAAAMYWLTIGEPAAKDGVYKFTSMPSMSGYSAKLLYAIGHMHDGGTDMRLFVNGKMQCKSIMHYSGAEKAAAGGMDGMAMDGDEAPAKKTTKKTTAKTAKAASGSEGMEHSHSKRDGHSGHGGGDMPHITAPGACTNFGTVSKGDRFTSEAWYDAVKHPLMVHNGKKENLMGNMRVYIGPN